MKTEKEIEVEMEKIRDFAKTRKANIVIYNAMIDTLRWVIE